LWQGTSGRVLGIGKVFGMSKGTGARTRTSRAGLDGRVRRIGGRRRGPQKVVRSVRGHVVQNESVLGSAGGLWS
jgi:hypothetical protein